jgi:hypothetical protein
MNSREAEVIKRISDLARRKLALVSRLRGPQPNLEIPVTLLEFIQYQKGVKPIPVCDLVSLLEFYGCSPYEISEWNVKISVLAFHALQKVRPD